MTHSGCRGRSAAKSSASMRRGRTTGTRVAKRIATTDDDVFDFGMRPQVLECWLQPLQAARPATCTDHAASGAKPAVNGTAVGRKEERSIRIAHDELWGRFVCFFAQGIAQV